MYEKGYLNTVRACNSSGTLHSLSIFLNTLHGINSFLLSWQSFPLSHHPSENYNEELFPELLHWCMPHYNFSTFPNSSCSFFHLPLPTQAWEKRGKWRRGVRKKGSEEGEGREDSEWRVGRCRTWGLSAARKSLTSLPRVWSCGGNPSLSSQRRRDLNMCFGTQCRTPPLAPWFWTNCLLIKHPTLGSPLPRESREADFYLGVNPFFKKKDCLTGENASSLLVQDILWVLKPRGWAHTWPLP